MRFLTVAETDVGIRKKINQDSVLIKHGECEKGEVLLAAVSDGMGGFDKGELASATVVRAFSKWFDRELPDELENMDIRRIAEKWSLLLEDLNFKIGNYGRCVGLRLGTTFTGVLFVGGEYAAAHVGDTRLYHLGSSLRQLTQDQTFVAREVRRGALTPEEARTDRRRNKLLQCVGAMDKVEPEIITGKVEKGAYLLCSDGFVHEISEDEIYESLNPVNLFNKQAMHSNIRYLIKEIKARREKDNISAVLIKVS